MICFVHDLGVRESCGEPSGLSSRRFSATEAQGYSSRDRQFAIAVLERALRAEAVRGEQA